jgi:hypothetical protein
MHARTPHAPHPHRHRHLAATWRGLLREGRGGGCLGFLADLQTPSNFVLDRQGHTHAVTYMCVGGYTDGEYASARVCSIGGRFRWLDEGGEGTVLAGHQWQCTHTTSSLLMDAYAFLLALTWRAKRVLICRGPLPPAPRLYRLPNRTTPAPPDALPR